MKKTDGNYKIYYRDPKTRSFKSIDDVHVVLKNGIPKRIVSDSFNATYKKIQDAASISYIWLSSNWK